MVVEQPALDENPTASASAGPAGPLPATAAGDTHRTRGRRALALVERYQGRYPRGSFGPEADALRIEALLQRGRRPEALALAERFADEHGKTPLAERVARLVQQAQP